MRKILVTDIVRSFTIDLPEDAKITFGPTIPFDRSRNPVSGRLENPNADRTYSLRIYRGNKENLYAVFPGVTGFRDLSLTVAEYEDELAAATEPVEESEEAPTPRRPRRRNQTVDRAVVRSALAYDPPPIDLGANRF